MQGRGSEMAGNRKGKEGRHMDSILWRQERGGETVEQKLGDRKVKEGSQMDVGKRR